MQVRLGAVEVAAEGGNVERIQIVVAEAAVGRHMRDRVCRKDAAVWREDVNHCTRPTRVPPGCGDDVTFAVQTHPVNAAMWVEIV